jgi:transposase
MAHTPTEMGENMVIWRFKQHKTAAEIARLAGCSESTVYEVLRLHREYGQVTNPHSSPRGRSRILQTADIEYIHSLLLANPAMYLDELQEQLLSIWMLMYHCQPYLVLCEDLH